MGRKKKNEPTAELTLLITKDKIEKVLPPEEPGGEPTLVQVVPPLSPQNTDPDPKPKRGRKKKDTAISGVATLADLAAAYAVQMEEDGKSNGTIASYGMELRLAQDELGAETRLADLTAERVGEYFSSKRVTKLRSGKAKSQLSIDKTRRVLRLALCWAADRGIIPAAPIPEPKPAK